MRKAVVRTAAVMIPSKVTISLLGILLLFSIFMASLLKIIATDHNFYSENLEENSNHVKMLENKYGPIANSDKNLFWFVQVSINDMNTMGDS